MRFLKLVWYATVAILCFFLIFGAILFCLEEWGDSTKYQGGVLVWKEEVPSGTLGYE
ncbi:MAG: hypothetical protein Q4D90_10885 [bacterium]|nr:hypothetical protein [bacterium]